MNGTLSDRDWKEGEKRYLLRTVMKLRLLSLVSGVVGGENKVSFSWVDKACILFVLYRITYSTTICIRAPCYNFVLT